MRFPFAPDEFLLDLFEPPRTLTEPRDEWEVPRLRQKPKWMALPLHADDTGLVLLQGQLPDVDIFPHTCRKMS